MPKVARVTDIWTGICCCHPPAPCIGMTGKIIEGSPKHESAGQKVGRLGDLVIGDCGHPGRIVSGAPKHESAGAKVARIGDSVSSICLTGKIVTGSPKHESS